MPTEPEAKPLQVSDFPPDLHRRMKADAALAGITLREFVIRGMRDACQAQERSQSGARRPA